MPVNAYIKTWRYHHDKKMYLYIFLLIQHYQKSIYCLCPLAHDALQLPFFFFFSFSTGFWTDWQFFFAYVLFVVAFNACEPVFTGHTGNCFVEVSCIVISGACSQDPQQVRRAEHAFESKLLSVLAS